MTAQQKSVFLKIREFISDYVVFSDPRYADICALWAIGTHVYKRFDSFGYMIITAATKRAGKSVLAECMSYVSHNGKVSTGITASVMREYIAQGKAIFFDESEGQNSESANQMRSYLNVGMRKGQTIPHRVSVDEIREMPAYSPKCFILIGDVNDTLRDRSIVIEMVRANASNRPKKIYRPTIAQAEGHALQGKIDETNGDSDLTEIIDKAYDGSLFDAYDYEMLQGREGEVWTAILSLAQVFCPDRLNDILACAADLSSMKQTTSARSFGELRKTEEGKKTDDTFTRMIVKDLHASFEKGEDRMRSSVAIERLRAIPSGPWRTYRGTGITPDIMFSLLDVFGIGTKNVRIGTKVYRGLYRKDINAAFRKIGDGTYDAEINSTVATTEWDDEVKDAKKGKK